MDKIDSWKLAYVGLKLNLIDSTDILKKIRSELIGLLEIESLTDLYCQEHSKEGMLILLQKIIGDDFMYEEETIGWQQSLLNKLKNNNDLTVVQKLEKISEYWALFDYPTTWSNFIYYLPNPDTDSPKQVYNNFINFLNHKYI